MVPPSDIAMMIMDYFDPGDAKNFFAVCPRWKQAIPARYWRQRSIKALGVEEDILPDENSLNWGEFYCQIEDEYHSVMSGLRNRARILSYLRTVRDDFLKSLTMEEGLD
ncbi:hypothetical protein BO71DRAFT_477312 [Aspergillus ellipticus CBS 707.79]|uniref:F-box domain-containing protein n=1 Tax=Aspergillus ellipticus CBS 707.79 TaxID=1448320 RepID=A0A319DRU7_9EURO|nr:hypothetical protein BO71DRAFT_477312 [Aspergillus ellipticus CBS 707.79]